MAERPIFVPSKTASGLVQEVSMTIPWHGGFSVTQKKKNIVSLHAAAVKAGYEPILEISTKSDDKVGQHLSAFHLKVLSETAGELPLESAYQGSKMFEGGGPFIDLFDVDARTAKRDPRLGSSGKLTAFTFDGFRFPLEPETTFYNWLYIKAIFPYREWLKKLNRYSAFTDIEFNPSKSINCQARACAYFLSLMNLGLLDEQMMRPENFILLANRFAAGGMHSADIEMSEEKSGPSNGDSPFPDETAVSRAASPNIRDQRQMEMTLDT